MSQKPMYLSIPLPISDGTVSTVLVDVAIIGAGPSGAVAAALLKKGGHSVCVLERQHFPRFSIGESLLPQSMAFLEEAGMLQAVVEAGFQYKNGALFWRNEQTANFDFRDKHSAGWGTTYQVERAAFDELLVREAANKGADVRFGHTVTAIETGARPVLTVLDERGQVYRVTAKFVLDASGFGRVLPRLLNLEVPVRAPARSALFTHIRDETTLPIDRSKIAIVVHPVHRDIWFWRIPLTNGRSSIGCVAAKAHLDVPEDARDERLRERIREEPILCRHFGDAEFLMPVRQLSGYAANVAQLHGRGYALLGNAAEFLDPVFSSGVTIALRSAHLAAHVLMRQLDGAVVDWQTEYEQPLRKGIDTFRAFVERWYSGELQDIIFHAQQTPSIRRMLSAILAGYAWDESNPYARDAARRLDALHEVIREGAA